jgi:hypothetical protein
MERWATSMDAVAVDRDRPRDRWSSRGVGMSSGEPSDDDCLRAMAADAVPPASTTTTVPRAAAP